MKSWLNRALVLAGLTLALVGCGSGGSASEPVVTPGGTTGPVVTVAVQILDPSGNPTTSVTSSSPGTVTATVRSNGSAAQAVVVTFTTSIGELVQSTALTDNLGVATVQLDAGSTQGAGTVTAKVDTPAAATGTKSFSTAISANNVSMAVTAPAGVISAGGTSTVTATLTNSDGSAFTTTVPVVFTSSCVSSGKATLDSPVNTVNGVAVSTYLAKGCVGSDVVAVSSTVGSSVLTGNATMTVAAASLGSIRFKDVVPESGVIAIKGTGEASRPETATVRFQVLDATGNPLASIPVAFSLDTSVGGVVVNPALAQTDANGYAQTIVTAGTVATVVRVTAIATQGATSFSTTSSRLVVSTGLPDQDSFSLSAKILNPEGWSVDGNTVEVTARLADAFNNPVPDGTAVNFRTEGGSIASSCTTEGGACSVLWTSQAPRPLGTPACTALAPQLISTCAQPWGGRATILATAIGTESFPDINGNGVFDTAEESLFLTGTDVQGAPYDIPEAFVDQDENNGYRTSAGTEDDAEIFVDFNSNGIYDAKDGKYNGVLCGSSTNCSTQKTLNVRKSLVMVMSDGTPRIRWMDATGTTPDLSVINVPAQSTLSRTFILSDLNNQPLPADTVVTLGTTNGTIVGTSSYKIPSTNHNGGILFAISVKGDSTPNSGNLEITVKAPSGLTTVIPGPAVTD